MKESLLQLILTRCIIVSKMLLTSFALSGLHQGGMPGPHQYPPPNHMMVPPHFQDSRGNFQRGRYNPNHGNGHYYQGRR